MRKLRMKKLFVYLDTSIISYLFADDTPEKRDITIEFFTKRLSSYNVYISDVVLFELSKTKDVAKRQMLEDVIKKHNLSVLPISDIAGNDISSIAEEYLQSGVIPPAKREDALHVATCTYFEFDILLSWNFRHLANLHKQMQINSINERLGYLKRLNLVTPLEVMDENTD